MKNDKVILGIVGVVTRLISYLKLPTHIMLCIYGILLLLCAANIFALRKSGALKTYSFGFLHCWNPYCTLMIILCIVCILLPPAFGIRQVLKVGGYAGALCIFGWSFWKGIGGK